MNKLKWLIAGGCGFLGTTPIKRLLAESGHSVRVLDNLSNGTRNDLAMVSTYREPTPDALANPPSGVELVVGDILDEQLAISATQGCDIIVHFATNTDAEPSVESPRANVAGSFNYLEARHTSTKSHVSSLASSGAPLIHEELPSHPVSPSEEHYYNPKHTGLLNLGLTPNYLTEST